MGMSADFIKKTIDRHNDKKDPLHIVQIMTTSSIPLFSDRVKFYYDDDAQAVVFMDKNTNNNSSPEIGFTPLDSLDQIKVINLDPETYPVLYEDFDETSLKWIKKASQGIFRTSRESHYQM